MTVNSPWNTELGKAEGAALATTRWSGLLRTLGYTVFIVYLILGVLALLGGLVTLFSDGASTGLPLLGGGILIALLGAIIAAPLLAISSYLAMGAHKTLAEVAHLEQTGRPLNAIGMQSAAPAAPAPPAPPVPSLPAPVAAPPAPAPTPAPAPPPLPPTGTPSPGDAPGFYDDPDDPGYLRYWGGTMWTDTRMPRP